MGIFGRPRDGRYHPCGPQPSWWRPDHQGRWQGWRWQSNERLYTAIQGALAEVDGLAALSASMILVEFVGEDLFAFATLGAFADKRFQVFERLIAGAMLGCGHNSLLLFSQWVGFDGSVKWLILALGLIARDS
jgi:hypothetical protein